MDERPLTLVMALRAAMWDHQWSTGDPELVSDNYTRHTFAEVIADGPLSDLSILVQIPLVRRITELLIDWHDAPDPFLNELADALEATDG